MPIVAFSAGRGRGACSTVGGAEQAGSRVGVIVPFDGSAPERGVVQFSKI